MLFPCRRCGGAPRPVKYGTRFDVVCCNATCSAHTPGDKLFYGIEFAYWYWNKRQTSGKTNFESSEDYELCESCENS